MTNPFSSNPHANTPDWMAVSSYTDTFGELPNSGATWTLDSSTRAVSFVPYPAISTGIPGSEEVGYGEGGYGEGGYDTPAVPGTKAPTLNWVAVTSK